MSVAHVDVERTRINVYPNPGDECLFRHRETGIGLPCVVVGVTSPSGNVLISYPSTHGRYSDGSRRFGWIKPRAVPVDDLYLACPHDLSELKLTQLKIGPCPHVRFIR